MQVCSLLDRSSQDTREEEGIAGKRKQWESEEYVNELVSTLGP